MNILYSTGCPKCKILEGRLEKDGIEFQISDNVDFLIEQGYQNAPVLQINGTLYTFSQAMSLLHEYEKGAGELQ